MEGTPAGALQFMRWSDGGVVVAVVVDGGGAVCEKRNPRHGGRHACHPAARAAGEDELSCANRNDPKAHTQWRHRKVHTAKKPSSERKRNEEGRKKASCRGEERGIKNKKKDAPTCATGRRLFAFAHSHVGRCVAEHRSSPLARSFRVQLSASASVVHFP